ncbi:MAG: zf-HC2 domain-containing protein, partial [Candidatus Acidiferrales bacterium]
MKQNGNRREDGNWSEMRPHEEFLELCAVSTTGELSADEQKKLKEHLATCSECRQALSEFRAVADVGAPLLSSELVTPNSPEGNAVPTEIANPIQAGTVRAGSSDRESDSPARKNAFVFARENGSLGRHVNWNYVWLPFAAAVLLTVALGIYSYQLGKRHASQSSQITDVRNEGELAVLERQLSDAGHERQTLRAQLAASDRMVRELQQKIQGESAALSDARNT